MARLARAALQLWTLLWDRRAPVSPGRDYGGIDYSVIDYGDYGVIDYGDYGVIDYGALSDRETLSLRCQRVLRRSQNALKIMQDAVTSNSSLLPWTQVAQLNVNRLLGCEHPLVSIDEIATVEKTNEVIEQTFTTRMLDIVGPRW